jgi:hypothetical protein
MKIWTNFIQKSFYTVFLSKYFFYPIFSSFIAILLGFFSASTLATILGQSGDWGILASGLLVAIVESTNKILSVNKKKVKIKYIMTG